ncbi:MAG: TIM barrel protein [Armatimonadota bacterium]
MKTSVAISWQETEFGAVAKGDAEELIRHARSTGYDAAELAVRDPGAVDVARLVEILDGMPVSAIGTGQAYLADGLSLSDKDACVRRAAVERLTEHCRLADKLNCRLVVIGLIRGRSGSHDLLVDNLRQVCKFAEEVGVRLVVEPINRYETELVNRATQGIELIEQVGMKNLGLLLDTFHMNIEESNPSVSLVSSRDKLWHMHLADSNRLAPGSGHVDFGNVIGLLRAVNYSGYISAETIPYPNAVTAMEMAIENMRRAVRVAA